MNNELYQFLAQFEDLSENDRKLIAEKIPVKNFKKGDFIIHEGLVPGECYFVLKGILREFQTIDGIEKTTAFYTEKKGTVNARHYLEKSPSDCSLVCLEDTLVICGTPESENSNYEEFPILKAITASMVESELHETKKQFDRFKISSPKERYLNMLNEEPELIQRASLNHIASYLGITPESLSRIRKRISTGD